MSRRVLVTACGGDLGQAVLKALRLSEEKYALHGSDTDASGVGASFVGRFHAVPKAGSADYLEKLDAICRAEGIEAVVPACDPEISVLSKFRRLPSGAAVVCQDEAWAGKYGDKLSCMRSLDGKVEIAPFADGSDAAAVARLVAENGFPLVVKPRRSFGSRLIAVVRDEAALSRALAATEAPLVQKYLEGDDEEYSAGIYGDAAGVRAVAFKRSLEKVGCSWYAETSTDASVLDYCVKIARASGLRGSANVQLRKTSAGPRLLEINARFSSLAAARAACGFNDADWSVRAALGLAVPAGGGNYRKLRFRRYFNEMVDFGDGFKAVDDWSPAARTLTEKP